MVVGNMIPTKSSRDQSARSQHPKMTKSLLAFAIFAALGTSVIALPAFAPKAKASEAVALAKADRLPLHSVAQTCLKLVWPDFATCLRSSSSEAKIVEARLVTARR